MRVFNKNLFTAVLTGIIVLFSSASFAGDCSLNENRDANILENNLSSKKTHLRKLYQNCIPTPICQWIDAITQFPLTEKALRRICEIEKIDVNTVMNNVYGTSRFSRRILEFQIPSKDITNQVILFIKQNGNDDAFMEDVGRLFVQNLKEIVNPYKTLDSTFHWAYFAIAVAQDSDIFKMIPNPYKEDARNFLDVRLQVIYTYKPPHTFSSEAILLMNALGFDPVERKIHEHRNFQFERRKPRRSGKS